MIKQEVQFGNFEKDTPPPRGWWVGRFADNPNFKTEQTEFQWVSLVPDKEKSEAAYNEISSTITMIVKGKITVRFPHQKEKDQELKNRGEYVYFAPGVCHSWKVGSKGAIVITLRWPSVENDQVRCTHSD